MSNRQTQRGGLLNRPSIWILLAVVTVGLVLGVGAFQDYFQETDFLEGQSFFEVKPGPIAIDVSVAGTIKSSEQVIIKSEVEGRATILFLIPEGTEVKEGDLLVELDATGMDDERVDQQIRVQNAEAAFVMARENLEIGKNQAQSDVEQAELVAEFARQDLQKYIDGELPKQVKELQENITLYDAELSRKEDILKWSQVLHEQEYLAETELKADELDVQQSKLRVDLAKDELDLLSNFTQKRMLAQLQSDVKQAAMALERTIRQASAEIVQASAELQAKTSEFTRQKSKLVKLEEQISKARIYAPTDGLVIYATSVRMSFRGNQEPLDEGQEVRERQELIYLPTTSAFVAEAKVHESSLEKVRAGLPVSLTVTALPGQAFTGRVLHIAPLADAQSMFMNQDLKVYRTEISIDQAGEDSGLRSGMNCRVEILVEEHNEATFVPMQAVVQYGGQPTVFVAKDDQWEKREIELGLDNNRMIIASAGLSAGDVVWLTPPLADASQTAGAEKKASTETQGGGSQGEGGRDRSGPGVSGEGNRERGSRGPGVSGEGNRERGSRGRGSREQGERGSGANRGGSGDRSVQTERGQNSSPSAEAGGGRPQGGPGAGGMSAEQREEMRKRLESMSPEEREAALQKFRGNRGRSSGEGRSRQP